MTSYNDYCTQHSTQPDEALYAVYRSIMLHTANPHMASSPYQGTFLQMITAIANPNISVEIGSHAGYGALCIARGMSPKGILHLIESNEEYEPIIWQNAKSTGLDKLIKLHIGQAIDIIPSLPDGIGLAFVDADKEHYNDYYTLLLPKMKAGGLLLFDNMLWYGQALAVAETPNAAESHLRSNREARIIHALNQRITNDPRVDNILLPIRDGIMLCRVK